MKTYILIPIAVLSFASVALSQNKPYLLATVLFYNDGKGHQIVAVGQIPKKVKMAIRKDIGTHAHRFGNTTAKVVPLFHQMPVTKFHKMAPSAVEITGFVKNKFQHIYLVALPKWLASKVVYEKSMKMPLRNMKNYRLDDLTKDNHDNDEALNTNLISVGKFDKTSINNIAKVQKTYYIPNTVIYAVETKCLSPADYSCYLNNKSRHTKAPHYNTFKKVFEKTTQMHSNF